ncbi:acyl carrier protein [Mycoplasmatota bacterium zrk1]
MIFEKVRDIIVTELAIGSDEVALDSSLSDDLNADSLDAVELIMAIEDEFNCEVPDSELKNIRTVKDIVDYLENL